MGGRGKKMRPVKKGSHTRPGIDGQGGPSKRMHGRSERTFVPFRKTSEYTPGGINLTSRPVGHRKKKKSWPEKGE